MNKYLWNESKIGSTSVIKINLLAFDQASEKIYENK